MKSPFIFGKVATGDAFINRETEIKKTQNKFSFQDQHNDYITETLGKSSLVEKVSLKWEDWLKHGKEFLQIRRFNLS